MILQQLTPDHAETVWPLIESFINQLADRFPDDWPVPVLKDQIANRIVVPWIIWDEEAKETFGLSLTEIHVKPSNRKMLHIHVVGRDPKRWVGLLPELEEYGRQQGADGVEIVGRQGWERSLPDYARERLALFTKELA